MTNQVPVEIDGVVVDMLDQCPVCSEPLPDGKLESRDNGNLALVSECFNCKATFE